MNENSRKIFEYLKEMTAAGKPVTGHQIADAMGVTINVVTGCVNALCKETKNHGVLAVREAVESVSEDGKAVVTKYISLTQLGMDFDPDATVEAKDE